MDFIGLLLMILYDCDVEFKKVLSRHNPGTIIDGYEAIRYGKFPYKGHLKTQATIF